MSETIVTKRCSKCKEIKSISEFYKHYKRKDGHQSLCKICQKFYLQSEKNKETKKRYWQSEKGKATLYKAKKRYNQSKKGREANICYKQSKKGKGSNKHYAQSKKGKATHNRYKRSKKGQEATKRYHLRYPEKHKAHDAIVYAIKKGKLPRPDTKLCHYCPKPAQEYHHHKGYAQEHWLDVIPVCIDCHNNLPIKSLSNL